MSISTSQSNTPMSIYSVNSCYKLLPILIPLHTKLPHLSALRGKGGDSLAGSLPNTSLIQLYFPWKTRESVSLSV